MSIKTILKRAKNILKGESGFSDIQMIVPVAIILLVVTALFLFKDRIFVFLGKLVN